MKKEILHPEQVYDKTYLDIYAHIPIVNYNCFQSRDNVIILCGGPSINNNYKLINEFLSKNNSTVIMSTNYHFSNIQKEIDYTVFIDPGSYKRFIHTITNKNVIIGPTVFPKPEHFKFFNFFKIKWNAAVQPYDVNEIQVNEDGSTNHKLGNCGFSCLFLSTFFKPKKILIAGFDGVEKDGKTLLHFNNRTTFFDHKNILRNTLKQKYLKKVLIPFLIKQNIEIYTFSNNKFYGLLSTLQEKGFIKCIA
jgi:hypothetical protein